MRLVLGLKQNDTRHPRNAFTRIGPRDTATSSQIERIFPLFGSRGN